ncbi:MAG: hypothetical protein IPL61_23745 [Myxococcales bacterium]|nr:hypothetical protein [Myxococcales bacterium]
MRNALLLLALVGCSESNSGPARTPVPAPTPTAPAPAAPTDDAAVFRALDAVGPIESDRYDPRPVIAAINALQPLGRGEGTRVLAAYLAARGHSVDERGGLFAVLRVLYEPPAARPPYPPDACTPRQRELISGPCVRPPMLGSPSPAPPEDLRSLRYPFFVLGGVPLSLVSGYTLAGKAETVAMHLEALATARTGWLAAPLAPSSPGEIRYLFIHYGAWSLTDEVGRGVELQLARLE